MLLKAVRLTFRFRCMPLPSCCLKKTMTLPDILISTPMDLIPLNPKLILIRDYLEKHLPHGVVEQEAAAGQHVQLSVTYGITNRCVVQVSLALLSDPLLDPVELRWALKEKNLAAHVRRNEAVMLDHKTLKIGDMGAMARRPRHPKAAVS